MITFVSCSRWFVVMGIVVLSSVPVACGDNPTSTLTATPTQVPMPTLGSVSAEEIEDDLGVLLDGVAEIGAPGVPGPLCIYGSEAFPVIVGAIGDVRAPVMAAGRRQAGRIVALGHDGYFNRPTLESLDTGRLMVNAFALVCWWRAIRYPHRRRRRCRSAHLA